MRKVINSKKILNKNIFILILACLTIAVLTALVLYKKTSIEIEASRGEECRTSCRKQYDRPNDPLYTKCVSSCINQDSRNRIQVGCQKYFMGILQKCAVNNCEKGRVFRQNPKTLQYECIPIPTPTVKNKR